MNKIAVILPVYYKDRIDFLHLAINSVLSQRNISLDLIIVIDGVIDAQKWQIIRDINDKNVILIEFNKNKGLPEILNYSIKYCIKKGYEYIARMDADDICIENRLEKQLKYLNNNLNCDILGTEAIVIDEKGKKIGLKKLPPIISYNGLFWRCKIIHPSIMFRASFFERYGYYNQNYIKSQDYELWVRATKDGAIIHNLNERLILLRYERDIIKRRKNEQFYNIKIKLKYFPLYIKFISIIPNLVILLLPNRVLNYMAKKSLFK